MYVNMLVYCMKAGDKMKTKINLYITDEMYEQLREESYKKRIKMSSIIRDAIVEYFRRISDNVDA